MERVIVSDLLKRFGDFTAVDQICFSIRHNEFFSLLGPSGCGKSTTLRCIAGLEDPDGGLIEIGGRRVFDADTNIPPNKRLLGMVFQNYAIWPHMTVYENISYPLRIAKKDSSEIQKTVTRVMETLGIGTLGHRKPHELSGGQQQRVALGRSLAMEPNLLLLDEPLSNLDAKLREEMRVELKTIQERTGTPILYVTHDQLEAMSLATHVAVMNEGKLEQYADPMTIYLKPATEFVATFVGSPPMNMVGFSDLEGQRWKAPFKKAVAAFIRMDADDQRICKVGFRAEAVTLKRSDDPHPLKQNQTCIKGHIKAVLPTGPEQIVSIVVDDNQFYVVTPPSLCFENGQSVDMVVDLTMIHVFDQKGLRI